MRTPLFWEGKTRLARALSPLSALYGHVSGRRRNRAPSYNAAARVVCVGNIVAGGAGKTPVALALGALLKAQGMQPHYLSRGYKGRLQGPVQVDPATHTVAEVGDEPLLLARLLPTWVAKDKVAGAKSAAAAGADVIVMDDGFQNPALHKDVSLLVIDGAYGFGNERLLPAGPLREPVASAMARATAIVILGEDRHHIARHVPAHLPVLKAHVVPTAQTQLLRDKRVIAFAGIARPRKFYHMLHHLGVIVVKMVAYRDHYLFKPKDMVFLRTKAKELEALLVTTAKDYVRLDAAMQAEVTVAAIEVVFEDEEALMKVISA